VQYSVIITKDDEGNWLISVPAFPGCHTWGETREEALNNAREAIEGCIESLLASGDSLPTEARPPEVALVKI
jgi:predicted RNase H-like HicB family nuclease